MNAPAPLPVAPDNRSRRLGLYAFLSRRKGPRSYIGKILLVAFLGTHIPLLALLAHFIVANSLSAKETTSALLVALAATLGGTGITLLALTQLLQPILLTRRGLQQYLLSNTIPDLPTDFSDDAGVLMTDTQRAIEKMDEMIEHLSHYDTLTALPNKTLFTEKIKQAVAQNQAANELLAVLVLDVNGLKNVNDLYEPQTGDRLLKTLAVQFAKVLGETDVLARIGSDEFAVLQTKAHSIDSVWAQARRLSDAASLMPIQINGHTLSVSVSVGIALCQACDENALDLLRDGEAAMYQAKQNPPGSDKCQFYSPEINAQMRETLACDADLRTALGKNEFVLHYQPQIDLITEQITGVEALIRWNHPVRGLVSPNDFIPVAEQNGTIVPIGQWALRTACLQNKAWQDAGLPPVRVAVNLSARQFHHPRLVENVAHILMETGLDPQWLELEITESLAVGSERKTIAILHQLRDLGIALSLDDFGTGYSSLSQLKYFPLQTLKIDRAFLHNISTNAENAAMVTGIIGLAHNLHLSVVAEGVETVAQADFLKASGCETSQGFLFSRPLPASDLALLLETSAFAVIK